MSSFTVKTAMGDCPYVGVPAFVSRAFRHNSIYVRTDRIKTPADLKGKRVGLPEYQLTACVWARAILEDDHGIKPSDVIWVRGGIDDPSRPEKITIKLPPGVRLENAPEGKTISQLLESGDIERLHRTARAAARRQEQPQYRLAVSRSDRGWTGILQAHRHFPDHACHRHPPHACRATSLAAGGGVQSIRTGETKCLEELEDTATSKCTLPFVDEQLKAARELMGHDFWSYGLAPNRKVLETFLRHHHSEGLSPRLVTPEEMFHPATHESFTI